MLEFFANDLGRGRDGEKRKGTGGRKESQRGFTDLMTSLATSLVLAVRSGLELVEDGAADGRLGVLLALVADQIGPARVAGGAVGVIAAVGLGEESG